MKIDHTTQEKEKYGKMTALEKKKSKDFDAQKETQEVLETGQEDEKKGKKVVGQVEQISQEDKKEQTDDTLSKLSMCKSFGSSYKETLAAALYDYLKILDWPFGWTADIVITDGSPIKIKGKPFVTKNGILLVVCTPDRRVFHQGMLTTQDPVLDYSAMMTLAIQTENQLDKEQKLLLDDPTQRTNLPKKQKIIIK